MTVSNVCLRCVFPPSGLGLSSCTRIPPCSVYPETSPCLCVSESQGTRIPRVRLDPFSDEWGDGARLLQTSSSVCIIVYKCVQSCVYMYICVCSVVCVLCMS